MKQKMELRAASLNLGDRVLTWGSRTYLMGILNITPDSFSGDGLLTESEERGLNRSKSSIVDIVVNIARQFIDAGADILDVGGESTRPGSNPVDADDELARVIPVIEALVSEFDALISIDTYKHEVAQAALAAGADMVNDIWGLKADPELGVIASRYQAPVILMHNRSSWVNAQVKERLGGRYINVPYDDLIEDIKRELLESVALAKNAGIMDERIILDPGIGFGKTVEQNLELMNRLPEIRALGYPLMIGPSRKSFIGYTLDLPPDQRLEGTAAAIAVGIDRGVDIIRVHDVEFMGRVARMTDAIVRG